MNKYIFTIKPEMVNFKPVMKIESFYEILDFPELTKEELQQKVQEDPTFFAEHTLAINNIKNDNVTIHSITIEDGKLPQEDLQQMIDVYMKLGELEEFLKDTKI